MTKHERNRLGGWLASNTAATVWTLLLGIGLAIFLLPIDSENIFFSVVIPLATIGAALLWRRRWIAIAAVGLALTLVVNTLLPIIFGERQIYFVRCADLIRCMRSAPVQEAGMQATIYPVADPVKWWIWSRVARKQERFRLIETGWLSSGEIVLHSPFERALARLAGDDGSGIAASGKLALPLGTLKLNVRDAKGSVLHANTGYGVTRRTFLRWSIPLELDAPGLFSSVGRPDDLISLAREAAGADLQARALLAGRWRELLASIDSERERTLRERVRDDYLADMLLDRSLGGNVFSPVRLIALRRALPPLIQLRRERPASDGLLRASVIGHANMLVFPQGPPSTPSEEHDYHPAEIDRFDDETSALFGLLAWIQDIPVDTGTIGACPTIAT